MEDHKVVWAVALDFPELVSLTILLFCRVGAALRGENPEEEHLSAESHLITDSNIMFQDVLTKHSHAE